MTAHRIHLIRHGEVDNPEHILYERLPGFNLSEHGRAMAHRTAEALLDAHTPLTRLYASPLERAQQSAQPIAQLFELPIIPEPRIIEAGNKFRGRKNFDSPRVLLQPSMWRYLYDPRIPSWGEPYTDMVARMLAAMRDAWESTPSGDVALVSHQLPIWIVHRWVAGEPLYHDARKRRCALSSVTTFERDPETGAFVEVDYQDPNAGVDAVDKGAV
ncbi:MAG TPA: histidine phosphatase family protein [Pseudoclavibacter sp.]|nr:histidine phosphatase family protein [Pseudoclavibacter sp.]